MGRLKNLKSSLPPSEREISQKVLQNFEWFKKYKNTSYPEVLSVIHEIVDSMKQSPDFSYPSRSSYQQKLEYHLSQVLLNLISCYFVDEEKFIGYHRDKNSYGKGSLYHSLGFSYRYMIKVINFLEQENYIENYNGVRFGNVKHSSRMRVTKKLISLIEDHGVIQPMIQEDKPKSLIILKGHKNADGKREILKYVDSPETKDLKAELREINQLMDKHVILLKLPYQDFQLLNQRLNDHPDPEKRKKGNLNFNQTILHRVFINVSLDENNQPVSLNEGGRFYGTWYQRVPNRPKEGYPEIEYRRHITINGLPTVEIDYSSLHPAIVYGLLAKKPLPEGDLYKLPDYPQSKEFRKFVKYILLMMLNVGMEVGDQDSEEEILRSKNRVCRAILSAVHREKKLKFPPGFENADFEVIRDLISAIENKHEPIKDFFYTEVGNTLQYHDSQIAESLMLKFAREYHTPLLPVHDSFIVVASYVSKLKDAMVEEFYNRTGQRIDTKLIEPVITEEFDQTFRDWEFLKKIPPERWYKEYLELKGPLKWYYDTLNEFARVKGIPEEKIWGINEDYQLLLYLRDVWEKEVESKGLPTPEAIKQRVTKAIAKYFTARLKTDAKGMLIN